MQHLEVSGAVRHIYIYIYIYIYVIRRLKVKGTWTNQVSFNFPFSQYFFTAKSKEVTTLN